LLANLSNKTTNKIPIRILKMVIQVCAIEKSGKNNDTFPIMSSSFHGHTPASDPAIKPTIIEIVIVLKFLSNELKTLDKKIKPKIEPSVNNIRTFNRYNLSGSLIKVKSSEADSIRVKYKAFTESTIISV
jgi:hypothetical protein